MSRANKDIDVVTKPRKRELSILCNQVLAIAIPLCKAHYSDAFR